MVRAAPIPITRPHRLFCPLSETMYQTTSRRTVPALGTLERPTAGLDCRSVIALEWAQHWALTRTRIKPQPGVVIRRALDLYADHLCRLPATDEATQQERRAIERAAKGSGSARLLTEARARLEAAEGLPVAFLDVLQSPKSRGLVAGINAAMQERYSDHEQ
jgi:hypothetical protein